MTNCPHCGGSLQIEITSPGRGSWRLGSARGNWSTSKMRPYHSAPFGIQDAPPFEFSVATRSEPVRAPTIQSDLIVPLGIAVVSGVLAGLLSWALALGSPLIIAIVTTGAVWAVAVIAWRRLLYLTETITGRDLSGDQVIGPPPLQVEITTKDGKGKKAMRFLELPTTEDRLELLCRGILGGRPLSQAEWCGGGKPFSRSSFEGVMERLESAGLVRWRDPENRAQGREATASGRAFCKSIVYPKK